MSRKIFTGGNLIFNQYPDCFFCAYSRTVFICLCWRRDTFCSLSFAGVTLFNLFVGWLLLYRVFVVPFPFSCWCSPIQCDYFSHLHLDTSLVSLCSLLHHHPHCVFMYTESDFHVLLDSTAAPMQTKRKLMRARNIFLIRFSSLHLSF